MTVKAETSGGSQRLQEAELSLDRGYSPVLVVDPGAWWIGRAGWVAPVVAVGALSLAIFCAAQIVAGANAHMTALAPIGLAALGAAAFALLRVGLRTAL